MNIELVVNSNLSNSRKTYGNNCVNQKYLRDFNGRDGLYDSLKASRSISGNTLIPDALYLMGLSSIKEAKLGNLEYGDLKIQGNLRVLQSTDQAFANVHLVIQK